MPHTNRDGERYCCLTCGTTYMVIDHQWVMTDPIIDLHEFTLDQDERTGN